MNYRRILEHLEARHGPIPMWTGVGWGFVLALVRRGQERRYYLAWEEGGRVWVQEMSPLEAFEQLGWAGKLPSRVVAEAWGLEEYWGDED